MISKHMIKEGRPGTSRYPAQNIIPQDAEKLPLYTPSYEFYYYSKGGQKTLYIQSVSYHAGILSMPLEKLAELVTFLLTD